MAGALVRAAGADPGAGRPRRPGGADRHLDPGRTGADAVLALLPPQPDRRADLGRRARLARFAARPSLQADRALYRAGERGDRRRRLPAVADPARASVRKAAEGLILTPVDGR